LKLWPLRNYSYFSRRGIDDKDPELIKDLDNGKIRGININLRQRAWLGIPYAQAPLGNLRYAPPKKVEPWDDTLQTREQPNACQQNLDTAFDDFEGSNVWSPNTNVSEDCLFLNVHAPRNVTKASVSLTAKNNKS
jgi:carboxylesterase type B